MKSYVIGLAILVVLAAGALVLLLRPDTQPRPATQPPSPAQTKAPQDVTDFPDPHQEAIVFDMKYRSLDSGKDPLHYYYAYWGFGGLVGGNTAFINDVKRIAEGVKTARNPHLIGAEWAAVEVKDKEPTAFYFDLDADGKLSDNEKILPTQTEDSTSYRRTEFVTPDFVMNTRDGNQVPFRMLVRAEEIFDGPSTRPLHCRWSPSCVLEGTSIIAGEPTKLILYTRGFSGSFKEFGRCSYSLLPVDEQIGLYIPTQPLSSLINHRGQYYRLKLHGTHEKNKSIRASLEKYADATGELAVKLTGNSSIAAKLSSASLIGTKDATIRFDISADQSTLPTGAYKLTSGYIDYGTESSDQCRVSFTEGPEFKIDAGKTCTVELGKPVLSVWAVEEMKRSHFDVKEQSVYAKGTNIYLQTKIRGKTGELYGRFSKKADNSRDYEDVEPTIRLVDSSGKEVASSTMEYG